MRSLSAPHARTPRAKATLKPLTTHCSAVVWVPRSVEIFGSAMAVPAMDIGVTNWAIRMIGSVQRLGGAAAVVLDCVDVAVMGVPFR